GAFAVARTSYPHLRQAMRGVLINPKRRLTSTWHLGHTSIMTTPMTLSNGHDCEQQNGAILCPGLRRALTRLLPGRAFAGYEICSANLEGGIQDVNRLPGPTSLFKPQKKLLCVAGGGVF